MDGSKGVKLEAGLLTVVNGTRAKIQADFPGVNIDLVCTKALPAFLDRAKKSGGPTPEMALAVIRQYAAYDFEKLASAPAPRGKAAAATGLPYEQILKTLTPEKQAEFRAKMDRKGGNNA